MKSTEKQYWFKRRQYGYGWTPVSVEGWLTVVIFISLLIGSSLLLFEESVDSTLSDLITFFAVAFVITFVTFWISSKHGPEPKWRWGAKPDDDPNEDI